MCKCWLLLGTIVHLTLHHWCYPNVNEPFWSFRQSLQLSSLMRPLLFKLPKRFPSRPLKCHFAVTMAYSIPALFSSPFRHTYAFSTACLKCALRRSVLLSLCCEGEQLGKTLQALPVLRLNSGNERVKFLCFLLDVLVQMVLWVDGWGSFRQLRLKW